ncbi:MAG: hypothetical protein ACI8WB_002070 [Phenylobacterium sp.]|jgi:uncharacterized protein (TIGR04255 family)
MHKPHCNYPQKIKSTFLYTLSVYFHNLHRLCIPYESIHRLYFIIYVDIVLKTLKPTVTLNNAPVSYVLCKIDCGDLLSFDALLAESQDVFRKNGFPIFYHHIINDVRINTTHGIKLEEQEKHTYHFISGDYQQGIVVSGGSVLVHTNCYNGFAQFAALVIKAHEIYSQVTEMKLVRAIGLRYIHSMVSSKDKSLDYYLQESMLSPRFCIAGDGQNDISPVEARMQHIYKTDLNSLLTLRIYAGKGLKIVPDDLIPLIEMFLLSSGKETTLPAISRPSALIDIDQHKLFQSMQHYSAADITKTLNNMHNHIDLILCNVAKNSALEEWK